MTVIYGVDVEKEVTSIMVRDALSKCFYMAHCKDSGIEGNLSQDYCVEIIKKAFNETGGDFDNPSKESLIKVIEKLADFSKNFRSPDIVKKHYDQISGLINKIK